jgi:hypothetical protein
VGVGAGAAVSEEVVDIGSDTSGARTAGAAGSVEGAVADKRPTPAPTGVGGVTTGVLEAVTAVGDTLTGGAPGAARGARRGRGRGRGMGAGMGAGAGLLEVK